MYVLVLMLLTDKESCLQYSIILLPRPNYFLYSIKIGKPNAN